MAARSTPWSRLDQSGAAAPAASTRVRTVAVIGAGASGLVAAKYLKEAGYEVSCFEKDAGIGGAFVTKAYDSARLVSSKFLTAFSDLRSPESDAPHLSLPDYVEYLKAYADKHDLWSLITFGARIESITRQGKEGVGGPYSLRIRPEPTARHRAEAYPVDEPRATQAVAETRIFDAVCVCSGLHEAPYVPQIVGLERFEGEVLHSADYKDSATFAGKRVLVIGCGETGMDLAYRAVQVASQAALSIKTGFLVVPNPRPHPHPHPHRGAGGVAGGPRDQDWLPRRAARGGRCAARGCACSRLE